MTMTLKNLSPGGLLQLILLLVTLHYRVGEAVNSEGIALQDFKQRLDDPVGALSNWNDSDITPCNWKGIVCQNLTNVVISINLPSRNLSGIVSPQLSNLKYLEQLKLHNNNFCGKLPEPFSNLTNLRVLNLRKNAFSGYIAPSLGMLKNLRIMELANNKLEGPIPESFGSLVTHLKYFNVSNNQLSGKVPEEVLRRFNGSSYLGNANLCGVSGVGLSPCTPSPALAPASEPSLPLRPHTSSLSLVQIILMSVGLFLAFKFGIAVLLILRWMRKDTDIEISLGAGGKIVMFQGGHGVAPTSREILRAMRLIRKKHIIGEGGYGVVYKLELKDHPPMAIKKLKACLESARSFENELDTLGTVKHRNLVKLRGFCSSPSVKLLIYDFLPGGNLDQLLHGEKMEKDFVVDWPIRYRIALGVARGLAYLHHGCAPRIIHGDVSSSNILLDTEFEPYLSDFGLAKLVTANDTHVSVTVGGTLGYVAPEFAKSGKATEKVDVYSYGVILLELLSGRRAVDESLSDEYANLAGWVRDLHSNGKATEAIDEYLRETVAGVDLDLLLEVAYHCISLNPHDRPQMNKVVETLEIFTETGYSPSGTSARTSHADPSKPLASDIPGFRPIGSYFIFDT
ncbi:hypothetical protein M758_4G044200 [Ceratodon purpureus]|nr:hypothetical protein M758_4G044200 [Ceratodon purpureus]